MSSLPEAPERDVPGSLAHQLRVFQRLATKVELRSFIMQSGGVGGHGPPRILGHIQSRILMEEKVVRGGGLLWGREGSRYSCHKLWAIVAVYFCYNTSQWGKILKVWKQWSFS